jgi:hypothetical protein
MKDLGSESVTPGLNHAPAFPMQGIGEQKTGGIGQVLLFMHDHQAFASIPLQPDDFCEHPATLLLPIATAYPYLPETLGVRLAQLRTHFVHAPPVTLPLVCRETSTSLTQCLPRLSIKRVKEAETPHYQRHNGPAGTGLRFPTGVRSLPRSPSVCGTAADGCDNATIPTSAPVPPPSVHSSVWLSLCRGCLRFQVLRVLNHNLKPIDPFTIGHHRRHHPLETRGCVAPHNRNSW